LAMRVVQRVVSAIDAWQQRHRLPAFVFGVIKKFGDDRGGHLAALIAYYGFLSIFPLLLVFVTTLGFFLHDNASLRHDLLNSALADFPIIGAQLKKNVHELGGNGLGLAIGIVGLLWGSLGVAQAAQHAMAEVWNVPGRVRPGFFPRLTRAVLVLAVLAVAIVATTTLTAAAALIGGSAAVTALTITATVALNIGLYWLAFRVLTPASIVTRDLWPGAIVGGVAWTGLQALGGWLVARQLPHTSELYGFFAIVLGLLFFLYLAGQLTVYAAADRATPAIVRPDERTSSTASRRNSTGYFDGRPNAASFLQGLAPESGVHQAGVNSSLERGGPNPCLRGAFSTRALRSRVASGVSGK
jgi:YihY family inner membrane protein